MVKSLSTNYEYKAIPSSVGRGELDGMAMYMKSFDVMIVNNKDTLFMPFYFALEYAIKHRMSQINS